MIFKISDIVVIKNDENRDLWEITNIVNGYVNLKGKTKRSLKVVKIEEIEKAEKKVIEMKVKERKEYLNYMCNNVNYLSRKNRRRGSSEENQIFQLPGSVLHLDTDKDYLDQCLTLYKNLNIQAVGFVIDPKEMPLQVTYLLKNNNPDILVITGHDLYHEDKDPLDINSYTNSKYFAQTVSKAREYEKDLDSLMIFAGACSSFFELLILVGANFASSPQRIEIEALDPAVVACHIALTPRLTPVDLMDCIEDTVSTYEGIGGVQTSGALKYATFPSIKGLSNTSMSWQSYDHCMNSFSQYSENSYEYANNVCNIFYGESLKPNDCMYDCVYNKGLDEENCSSYVCRKESSEDKISNNITIVIDPGHSSVGNVKKSASFDRFPKDKEYEINYNIGIKLKDILEEYGYDVIMTKNRYDELVSSEERTKLANEVNADLVLKLHCNRDNDKYTSGALSIISYDGEDSSDILSVNRNSYCENIINEYCNSINIKNRGAIKKKNFRLLSGYNVPVVLLGMGFLTNNNDNIILNDNMNIENIAQAIANGVVKCFNNN